MTAPGSRAPAHLHRYLLGSERLVVAVRRHPARLVEPVASAVAGLVAAIWLDTVLTGGIPVLADAVWLGWAALVVRALWRLAEWHADWFVATDQRLILTYGLITRKVAMMPLIKVTDLSYNRSPLGRVLGYGEFVLESAGQDQAMRSVTWLPSPDVLYRRICGEIFDPRHHAGHLRSLGRLPVVREPVAREPVVREPDAGRRHDTEPVPMPEPDGTVVPDGPVVPDGTERPASRWRR